MQTRACSPVPANRPSSKSLETQAMVAWWLENPGIHFLQRQLPRISPYLNT